jgi:hypothetical protein
MRKTPLLSGAVALVLLGGCVTAPTGPDIPVSPGQGKSFADFQRDDYDCQGFAEHRVAGKAESANDHAILSAIIGAGLGAALGGAIGGGNGAAIGAAGGGVAGSAVGADQSGYAQGNLQRRYDMAYGECMAAKGNDVPYFGRRGPRGRYEGRDDDRYGPPPPSRDDDYGPPPPPPPPRVY